MKKKLLIGVVSSMILFSLSACGTSTQETTEVATTETTTTETVTTEEPTTEVVIDESFLNNEENGTETTSSKQEIIDEQVRHQMDALIYIQDGWIYGIDWNDSGKAYLAKEREDGGDFTKLDDFSASDFYLNEGYLYYARKNTDENGGIFKMRTSGENQEKIVDKTGIIMQVVNNQIYYTPDSYLGADEVTNESTHLFRCDMDGKNEVEIISKPTYCWYIFDNAIIYQDDRDNCSLHICDIDGKNDKKINNEISYCPIYDGEYIYYSKENPKKDDSEEYPSTCIWKIKLDGTEDTKVADYVLGDSDFALHNGYIYFVNEDDNDRIYKMKTDGTELTQITQEQHTSAICFFNNRLCYKVYDNNYTYLDHISFSDEDGSNQKNWSFNK